MAIIGDYAPRIGSLNIDYVVMNRIECRDDGITHKSTVTLNEIIVQSGQKLYIEMICYYYKYGSPDTFYASLRALIGSEQDFWLNRNETAIRNAENSANANFLVESVTPYLVTMAQSNSEACIIKLRSTENIAIV